MLIKGIGKKLKGKKSRVKPNLLMLGIVGTSSTPTVQGLRLRRTWLLHKHAAFAVLFPKSIYHTIPLPREVYSCATTVTVRRSPSAAPDNRISIANVPRCFTRFPSSVFSINEMLSGESTIGAPSYNSASIACTLAAMSLVDTEPYMPVFPCAAGSTSWACLSAAAAEIAELAGIDGDTLFNG